VVAKAIAHSICDRSDSLSWKARAWFGLAQRNNLGLSEENRPLF
jgi:hypothetical protein